MHYACKLGGASSAAKACPRMTFLLIFDEQQDEWLFIVAFQVSAGEQRCADAMEVGRTPGSGALRACLM